MILFRSVCEEDIPNVIKLAQKSGIGITTFPKRKALLTTRIDWAINSFASDIQKPSHEYYFFVLEDTESNEIVGSAAIESSTGFDAPFYSYKLSKHTAMCHSLNIRTDYEELSLVNDNQDKSELCTLFLKPEYRKNNNGLLLSRARFLFMAQQKHRFSQFVFAEMRGISDEHGNSPFWDSVGGHFFKMPFDKADRLTIATNKQFIADLMPKTPIYISILPKNAQDVIGKPHPLTIPAMNILLKEGFYYNNYVDIFDAGPTIEARFNNIKSIADSQLLTIGNISNDVDGENHLISNTLPEFRATLDKVLVSEATCTVSTTTARLLQVGIGDKVRIVR